MNSTSLSPSSYFVLFFSTFLVFNFSVFVVESAPSEIVVLYILAAELIRVIAAGLFAAVDITSFFHEGGACWSMLALSASCGVSTNDGFIARGTFL
jgi:hypothetical protein